MRSAITPPITNNIIKNKEIARAMTITQPIGTCPCVEKDCVFCEKKVYIVPGEPEDVDVRR